ncbi:C40 family peptidase [Streptomyces sp. NBC_00237]|uniref:C40 family peptidase n=1 Tax=Streptomyces sp. NBC_00237 TaxID=2975687 RepID=UPI002250EE4B|nr:C40 family peptidase [Streptomyces sp. NBC_00237]MCX5204240.1 C40 family peptidase [Streptomyces sp. NBC_00237]
MSRFKAAVVAAATVLAVTGGAAHPAQAAPGDPGGIGQLLTDLQRLYQQTEEATEAFNATAEKLTTQRTELARINGQLSRARVTLAEGKRAAGQLAREQYKGRGDYAYSSLVTLLTSSDPDHALAQGHTLRRAAAARALKVTRWQSDEKKADALATRARAALDTQQTLAVKQKKARDAVQARLKQVEATLAALTADELASLAALESRTTERAQRDLIGSGAFGPGGVRASRAPSREGDRALAYATRQLGKPYVWGAEGPDTFDCSGLTQQAWAAAGRTIPRTSQEQWAELPRVPLSALRPGDLVVYFPKATHVAIYLGNGQVVQAPRPGAHVKVSPIASNPVLGAVRPDPALAPLSSYVPPDLPTGRDVEGNESDAGYGAQNAPE